MQDTGGETDDERVSTGAVLAMVVVVLVAFGLTVAAIGAGLSTGESETDGGEESVDIDGLEDDGAAAENDTTVADGTDAEDGTANDSADQDENDSDGADAGEDGADDGNESNDDDAVSENDSSENETDGEAADDEDDSAGNETDGEPEANGTDGDSEANESDGGTEGATEPSERDGADNGGSIVDRITGFFSDMLPIGYDE